MFAFWNIVVWYAILLILLNFSAVFNQLYLGVVGIGSASLQAMFGLVILFLVSLLSAIRMGFLRNFAGVKQIAAANAMGMILVVGTFMEYFRPLFEGVVTSWVSGSS